MEVVSCQIKNYSEYHVLIYILQGSKVEKINTLEDPNILLSHLARLQVQTR
jgi:hypothetical protein